MGVEPLVLPIPHSDEARGLHVACHDPACAGLGARIEDRDGDPDQDSIRRWLKLAKAVGLNPDYVTSCAGVMRVARFAVDAYVRFVRNMQLLDTVAASLTEIFAPKIHAERIKSLLRHYAFADDMVLSYFHNRLTNARKDVTFGLCDALRHADTAERQDAASLIFKTDVHWAQLDAHWSGYVEPGRIPPGAWLPGRDWYERSGRRQGRSTVLRAAGG